MGEIEESSDVINAGDGESAPLIPTPNPNPDPNPNPQTKAPEVELHLYRQGRGPIDVIKTPLGGYEQDQLEIRDILDKYGFKSLYAFNPDSGRGVPIRFNPRNGRSVLTYSDGAVLYADGEPKDSLIQPITTILVGVAVMTVLIVVVMKESPDWAKRLNFSGGRIPPWVLACVVIVFTRMRKRTKNFLEKRR